MARTLYFELSDFFRRAQILVVVLMFLLTSTGRMGWAGDVSTSLVGHWDFDDGTGKDLSGNGNDAVLERGTIYSLGQGHACVRFMPDADPMRIPASENSPLAISRGTICFWLNTVTGRNTLVKYDNKAVEINAYRGDFQVRFSGEDDFRYWDLILDYDWPKYDMREWAFYGHLKASVDDSVWHLFAVAYDDQNRRIIGWRDGELISVVDLSTVETEPLRRQGLTEISTGEGFIGFMDDLRIYNKVLTDADIRKIFDSTKSIYAGRHDTIPTDKEVETYKYRKEDHALYSAWLQYNTPSERLGESLFKSIVAEGSNSTIRTAASELSDAVESMFDFTPTVKTRADSVPKIVLGTAETSSWIYENGDKLKLDRIKEDGFIIKAIQDGSDTTLVIDKGFPSSWVEKWKWWLQQDTYRSGPGSLNKSLIHCLMGVAMISPSPAWTDCPLNQVNYYGLGRLAWNPDRSLDEIYNEWIVQTFGDDLQVLDTINRILLMSDDVARKLYMYRGYRGIWIDKGDENMVENKTPYAINRRGIGPASPALQDRLIEQYAPGLREVYGEPVRGEEFLSAFHFKDHDYRLSIGRTLIEDVYGGMEEAVQIAKQMVELWKRLEGKIDQRRFDYTLENLAGFVEDAKDDRDSMAKAFEDHTGTRRDDVLSRLTAPALASVGTFNVRHYGAAGDGTVNDAPAINKAIEACNAAGGGTVFVPSGIYTSGSIHLKSNVKLALDKGAVLKAMPGIMDPWEPNPNDKGLMDSAYYHWEASLIWGKNLENVKIYGPGTLDGSALTRSSKVKKGTGDKGIALKLCRNIEIRNLNIREGGHYAVLATGCENILIDNVTIKTSRDGLNLSQCRNVEVIHCHIDAVRYQDGYPAGGDDAIKLGSDLSLGKALPSENITVKNCFLASGCNTLQFGTETIGSFKNILFENIRIIRAGKAGISITSNDGSVIDGVHYKDISMEKTFVPIFMKVSDVARVPEGTYERGAIRNITLENITATDCFSYFKNRQMPSVIWGKPGSPIENIELKNVRIISKGGHPASEASLNPAENDERFPRRLGGIPAYAWYLRHVRNVRFVDCRFGFEKNDGRPALFIDDGQNVAFKKCYIQKGADCISRVGFRNTAGANQDLRN